MAEVFDPRWEYYTGDPEVEEILSNESCKGSVALYSLGLTEDWRHRITGYRLTDIDHIDTLPFYKSRIRHERDTLNPKQCLNPKCRELFYPRVRNGKPQQYCSVQCSPHLGRKRVLSLFRKCVGCGVTFKPLVERHHYCNHPCYIDNASNVYQRVIRESGERLRKLVEEQLGCMVKPCKECNGPIVNESNKGRGKYREYCSSKCRTRYKNRKYWVKNKSQKNSKFLSI